MRCYRYQESDNLSDAGNPYRNLATEEFLVQYMAEHIQDDRAIIYLWRNVDCVVFGRNQNPSDECRLDLMEELGVLPVRRKTGGGAVFHDRQNLNFSFIVPRRVYDKKVSMQIVVRALQSCGIDAKVNGRNDIMAGGCKVSGNAYLSKGETCLHHGTLLISTDTEKMERLLTVNPGKLAGKGIRSVRSRVRNLRDIMPSLTIEDYENALAASFLECYAGNRDAGFTSFTMEDKDRGYIRQLQEDYASKEWIFGHELKQTWQKSRRFDWGSCTIQGEGDSYRIYSDTLYTDAFDQVRKIVQGQIFGETCIENMSKLSNTQSKKMLQDIHGLIKEYMQNNSNSEGI